MYEITRQNHESTLCEVIGVFLKSKSKFSILLCFFVLLTVTHEHTDVIVGLSNSAKQFTGGVNFLRHSIYFLLN